MLAIPASRLGYRITSKFVRTYLARVFDNPSKVLTEEILRPEQQDPASFSDGILYIVAAQKRVALRYLEDGGYEMACPPLRAVLSIMAYGDYEGKPITDPSVRRLDAHTLEVDKPQELSINDLFERLSAQNIRIGSMRNKANRLEELFLKLVEQKKEGADAGA